MLNPFSSYREYQDFALAKGFCTPSERFSTPEGKLEWMGNKLVTPIFGVADGLLQNIRNPLMVVALTMVAIAAVSIAFYPVEFIAVVAKFAPFMLKITPQTVQMCLYSLSQATIAGVGMRTLGRLNNQELMRMWNSGELRPIPIGATIEK